MRKKLEEIKIIEDTKVDYSINRKIVTQLTKVRGNKDLFIDYNKYNDLEILKKSKTDKNYIKGGSYIDFCIYNTKYQNKSAMIMVFNLDLPGSSNGSSKSSQIIIDLIKSLEKILLKIDYIFYSKDESDKFGSNTIRLIRINNENMFI